jgi:hypothetical protein
MTAATGVASTRWFCAEGCHDTEAASVSSHQASTHAEVSCMACHMEVGSNPLVYMFHKAQSLGGLYSTLAESDLPPLNANSRVALTMQSSQCTQCHDLSKRKVTPARGILIDHESHDKNGVACSVCHNRIGHQETFKLAMNGSDANAEHLLHPDFMTMKACFRCHSQTQTPAGGLKAPGECEACHTSPVDLKPDSHFKKGFFPKGHAKLGQEEAGRVASFEVAAEVVVSPAEETTQTEGDHINLGSNLTAVGAVNECNMCHSEKFCSNCHGLPMPHPVDFADGHAKLGQSKPKVCSNCHGQAAQFCNECHHGAAIEWKYVTARPWREQHPGAVQQVGPASCFKCHHPTYCAECHVKGRR